jgi:hypothetical protein
MTGFGGCALKSNTKLGRGMIADLGYLLISELFLKQLSSVMRGGLLSLEGAGAAILS